MGYYTTYKLSWEPHDEEVEIYLEANHDTYYGITSRGEANDQAKWYEHAEDMKRLSAAYPHILFTLSGEGEEAGDIWKKYYKAGKEQVCKAGVVIPSFDESKLR